MKTTIVQVRLTPEELSWLDRYVKGAAGYATRSEYLRYLLHHEHAKRSGTTTSRKDFDTEWRIGRPRNCTTVSPQTNGKVQALA